jgi:hypothetical protein
MAQAVDTQSDRNAENHNRIRQLFSSSPEGDTIRVSGWLCSNSSHGQPLSIPAMCYIHAVQFRESPTLLRNIPAEDDGGMFLRTDGPSPITCLYNSEHRTLHNPAHTKYRFYLKAVHPWGHANKPCSEIYLLRMTDVESEGFWQWLHNI